MSKEKTERKTKEKGFYEVLEAGSGNLLNARSYEECLSFVKTTGEVGKTYSILRVLKVISVKEVTVKKFVS